MDNLHDIFMDEDPETVTSLLEAVQPPGELAAEMQGGNFARARIQVLVSTRHLLMPTQIPTGIATAANISYFDVLMANYFYEITATANLKSNISETVARSCTSIVGQRSNGTIYLGRNQVFPTKRPPEVADMNIYLIVCLQ